MYLYFCWSSLIGICRILFNLVRCLKTVVFSLVLLKKLWFQFGLSDMSVSYFHNNLPDAHQICILNLLHIFMLWKDINILVLFMSDS